jgi:SAM-dependent methyltransferase
MTTAGRISYPPAMPRGSHRQEVLTAVRDAGAGRLPDRYAERVWIEPYLEEARRAVTAGQRVIDVGSGAHPVLSPAERPPGVDYVGLDISARELELAGPCAYDDTVVASITDSLPELAGSFDLALSFHVFEHVHPLQRAIATIRDVLKPGGRLVAQVPGRYSMVAVLNRAIPHSVAKIALHRLLNRDPSTVFPAHYDQCWHDALVALFADWTSVEVRPIYACATYLNFAPPLRALYVGFEEWLVLTDRRNLATNYHILATR